MTTPAIILGLLILPYVVCTAAGRLRGQALLEPSTAGCLGLLLVFGFTGVGHFIRTEPMAAMLPEWVPLRVPLVYVTGVAELALAIAVVVPRLREAAGWILVAMLLLFLPVNIYAAVQRLGLGGHLWGPVYLLIRVPLQLVLIGWTWFFAIRPSGREPIWFACSETLRAPPEEIARQILDLSKWPEFQGYGMLPGIRSAEFETRTAEIVGTRIRVTNTDGSRHVEEICVWDLPRRLEMRMRDFSPPLSRLATEFLERWDFSRDEQQTEVTRSFAMFPTSSLARPALWLISRLLRKAVARHLYQLRSREHA